MRRRELTARRAYAGMSPGEAAEAHAVHRRVLKVLAGLMLAMFLGAVSSLIVGNALPVIAAEIGGTQQQYTWIMTAAILAQTAATPIAGKLSDLYDKKRLLLGALVLFALGSLTAGFSTSPGMLIALRVVQGIGMGSIMVLVQVSLASIVPPRQRGRYNVYLGTVFAVSTVSAPLIGGVVVGTSWLGWRWCFWAMLPFTLLSLVVLAKALRVPEPVRREARVDWGGAVLIALSAALFLLVISFAGHSFDWLSWQTAALLAGVLVTAAAFVLVERRVREPVVPLRLLTDGSTVLAIIANLGLGTVLMGTNIILLQHYQIGRGFDPMIAGWLTLPVMLGMVVVSSVSGNLVARSGRWKPHVVGGMAAMTAGTALLGLVRTETPLWLMGLFLMLTGAGVGAAMQNLVTAVQNSNSLADVGAATSTITFFRTLGGAAGIQVLGVVYATRVASLAGEGLAERGLGEVDVSSLDLSALPSAAVEVVREAYGDGVGVAFLAAALASLIGLVAVCLMRSTELRGSWEEPATSPPAEEDVPAGQDPADAPHEDDPADARPSRHASCTAAKRNSAPPPVTLDPAPNEEDEESRARAAVSHRSRRPASGHAGRTRRAAP